MVDETDETLAVRKDGRPVSTTTYHAVLPDAARVSDVLGRGLPCSRNRLELLEAEDGLFHPRLVQEAGTTCRVELAPWRAGDPMPAVLCVEAGCNVGKSYAVHHELIMQVFHRNE